MKRILLLLVFSLSCTILSAAEMRSWTGSNGKAIPREAFSVIARRGWQSLAK